MLLPQFRSEQTVDARGGSLAAMAVDLIDKLQRHELLLPVDERCTLAPSEFYTAPRSGEMDSFFSKQSSVPRSPISCGDGFTTPSSS
jgi:hypothetical protein